MSKARVVVLEVISGHLSVTDAASVYGLSRQHIYRLLKRCVEGLDAVEPRSRRPASNPCAVSDATNRKTPGICNPSRDSSCNR